MSIWESDFRDEAIARALCKCAGCKLHDELHRAIGPQYQPTRPKDWTEVTIEEMNEHNRAFWNAHGGPGTDGDNTKS